MSKPSAGKAVFEAVLVYYDEPQVMLLSRSDDRKLIAVAIAEKDGEFPFFAAEISFNQWDRYRRGITDLRYLFNYPKHKKWYRFNFEALDIQDRVPLRFVPYDAINTAWLSSPGFFAREHTEPDTVSSQLLGIETFLIDGSWDFADFSGFYGKFAEIYSFLLALAKFNLPDVRLDTKKIIKSAFSHYPFMGGSSYRHFYEDLLRSQSYSDRLSVREIQYASPGHVDVFARPDIFDKVTKSLEFYGEHHSDAAHSYKVLRDYLGKSRLLQSNASEFDSRSAISEYIHRLTTELCAQLSFEELGKVDDLVECNKLAAAKIMLSYSRRVERSYMFFAEGRVKLDRHSEDERQLALLIP